MSSLASSTIEDEVLRALSRLQSIQHHHSGDPADRPYPHCESEKLLAIELLQLVVEHANEGNRDVYVHLDLKKRSQNATTWSVLVEITRFLHTEPSADSQTPQTPLQAFSDLLSHLQWWCRQRPDEVRFANVYPTKWFSRGMLRFNGTDKLGQGSAIVYPALLDPGDIDARTIEKVALWFVEACLRMCKAFAPVCTATLLIDFVGFSERRRAIHPAIKDAWASITHHYVGRITRVVLVDAPEDNPSLKQCFRNVPNAIWVPRNQLASTIRQHFHEKSIPIEYGGSLVGCLSKCQRALLRKFGHLERRSTIEVAVGEDELSTLETPSDPLWFCSACTDRSRGKVCNNCGKLAPKTWTPPPIIDHLSSPSSIAAEPPDPHARITMGGALPHGPSPPTASTPITTHHPATPSNVTIYASKVDVAFSNMEIHHGHNAGTTYSARKFTLAGRSEKDMMERLRTATNHLCQLIELHNQPGFLPIYGLMSRRCAMPQPPSPPTSALSERPPPPEVGEKESDHGVRRRRHHRRHHSHRLHSSDDGRRRRKSSKGKSAAVSKLHVAADIYILGEVVSTTLHSWFCGGWTGEAPPPWRERCDVLITLGQTLQTLAPPSPPCFLANLSSLNIFVVQKETKTIPVVAYAGVDHAMRSLSPELCDELFPHWAAPEVLRSGMHSSSSIVYTFGMLIWEAAARKIPFGGKDPSTIQERVLRDVRPKIPKLVDGNYANLIRLCLSPNPYDRPDLLDVIKWLHEMRRSPKIAQWDTRDVASSKNNELLRASASRFTTKHAEVATTTTTTTTMTGTTTTTTTDTTTYATRTIVSATPSGTTHEDERSSFTSSDIFTTMLDFTQRRQDAKKSLSAKKQSESTSRRGIVEYDVPTRRREKKRAPISSRKLAMLTKRVALSSESSSESSHSSASSVVEGVARELAVRGGLWNPESKSQFRMNSAMLMKFRELLAQNGWVFSPSGEYKTHFPSESTTTESSIDVTVPMIDENLKKKARRQFISKEALVKTRSMIHNETVLGADQLRKISMSDCELEYPPIGNGSFSMVYKAQWCGTDVAIKRLLPLSNVSHEQQRRMFLNEALLMNFFSGHPNIVSFCGVVDEDGTLALVTAFCHGGTLEGILSEKRRNREKPTSTWCVQVAIDVATGLKALHHLNVAHRDVASRNVLLDKHGTAILADLGLTRYCKKREQSEKELGSSSSTDKTESNLGPVKWMPPEAIERAEYSLMTDCWSFGVLLWEITTCKVPWEGKSIAEVAKEVGSQGKTLNAEHVKDHTLRKIIQACWRREPRTRPKVEKILVKLKRYMEKLKAI